MQKVVWLTLSILLMTSTAWAGQDVLEYPSAILDLHDADKGCWMGMDINGRYPAPVVPEQWLVGPPPSEGSAVTFPTDHWVDLGFSGRIVDGDGNDITVVESGQAGEQALLFVTDGADQEYLLTKVAIGTGEQELSNIGIDLRGILLPFVPRALRLVALDRGGLAPGFDLAWARARVSHDCGTQACCPNPVSGSAGINPDTRLMWSPGYLADQHVVFLSTDGSQVRSRKPVVRFPAQPRDANTFEPPVLQLGETYYWCVDELGAADANQVRRGDVWSFTVADCLVIDDFESYVGERLIYEVWQPTMWSGVSVEEVVGDVCQHCMVFGYYYDDYSSRSAVFRRFEESQDWTRAGATVLQLLLYGSLPDPAVAEMYVALSDGVNEQLVPYSQIVDVEGKPDWHVCRVLLEDFHDVDRTNIRGIAVGIHPVAPVQPGEVYRGTISVAEIGLYRTLCLEDRRPKADLTGDCAVDYRDLERLALEWLEERTRVYKVSTPNEPVLWYEFEGNANDSAGEAHGQVEGRVNYVPGVHGQAIHFMNQGDGVSVPQAASVFAGTREAITITFWQRGDDSTHLTDTICCSNYAYGQSNPTLAIHLGCWKNPGYYRWDCGNPWSFNSRLAGKHQDKSEWAGRWNHWAFTKDIRVGPEGQKGRMEIYLNGELYDSRTGTDTPIDGITSFTIGYGWYGYYDGLIDDFQIYDYALSPAEIAYVATGGTGIFPQRPTSAADLDSSDRVDIHDFSILADEWLQDGLWP